MIWIDSLGSKYKTVKKDGKYYLLQMLSDRYKGNKYDKIEVTGKENVLTYIKNNGLKKYEEVEEWVFDE